MVLPYAHSIPQIAKQYAWLERELEETDRTKTPWVVTAAHRPMYCSPNDDKDECHQAAVGPWHRHSFIRKGVLGKWGFEELLYRHGRLTPAAFLLASSQPSMHTLGAPTPCGECCVAGPAQ